MHDTFLLSKISKSLKDICVQNKIKTIENFVIAVNHNSHINEENLREHLEIYNKDNIAHEVKIKILREDIEEQTAIIKILEGETFDN